jgi:hypothetical protein
MFAPDRIVLWAPWMVVLMPLFGFIVLAFLGGLAKKQGKEHGMMVMATACTWPRSGAFSLCPRGITGFISCSPACL